MDMDEQRYQLTMSEIMTPDQANFAGNIHGGHIMRFLDKVAYACAARYSGRYVVTLSVDQLTFKKAIHVADLVTCLASINHVGTSSMEVGIKVISENLKTGESQHTNTCFFTMIALDDNHKPTAIEPLKLVTEKQKQRFQEAEKRKASRLALHQAHEKNH